MPGIYDLFDKVLVLDQGRQVYFGPPKDARAYFENLGYKSLPRQSTPDYLTGCTDPNERQFAPGLSHREVPSSPEALESAFLSSPYGSEARDTLEKYKIQSTTEKTDQEAFRAAVIDDKKKGVSKKSPYTLGLSGQILALARREFQKKTQDRFQLYTSFSISTVCSNPSPFFVIFTSFPRLWLLLSEARTMVNHLLLLVLSLAEGICTSH